MLEVQEVRRSFGGSHAVDGVSFTVPQGAVTGLIGPNGAGKTTMFNLIAGSLALTSGRLLLEGRRIDREPAHRRLARGLARTFQIPRPFPSMSVLENVLLAAKDQRGERVWPNWFTPGAVAAQEHRHVERARDILDFLTLTPLAEAQARTLSGGQRKLLELARVLMAEPKIILLDEPAAGVNPSLLETIMDRIATLNRRGMTFLIVEHNMDLVARLCGQVLVMASGKLLAQGRPDEVIRDPAVVEAYLGAAA